MKIPTNRILLVAAALSVTPAGCATSKNMSVAPLLRDRESDGIPWEQPSVAWNATPRYRNQLCGT